ncbi:MAG: MFS transporter [Leadbetterella sp.]|nr:MFS transporter [Leadbetterella sp.]
MPYMSTVFVQSSSDTNRGAYMGMYSLAFSVAHIISPYFGTYTIEHWGFETLWWVTGGITVLTAGGFYFLMRR